VASLELKENVREYWEKEVCGSRYATEIDQNRREYFAQIEKTRYEQDYMLRDFARFAEGRDKKVLEVGLGAGTDLVQWARAGAATFGRDLTQASVDLVQERLAVEGLHADVAVGDAEALEFPNDFFDIYYSWGVLHHTPDTEGAISEALRVLKPGGKLRIMLYHSPSVAAYLVWLLYGPLRLRWISPRRACADHIESAGTKVYSRSEAERLVAKYFSKPITVQTYLGSGDLLTQRVSSKYQGLKWRLILKLYPRWFVRNILGHRFGGVMTIEATK